uniref:Uncharacterized protein n=1 Tax=Arundo donax TaxID=35708 RepID=A0A0A9EWL0_ARUDO
MNQALSRYKSQITNRGYLESRFPTNVPKTADEKRSHRITWRRRRERRRRQSRRPGRRTPAATRRRNPRTSSASSWTLWRPRLASVPPASQATSERRRRRPCSC